MYNPYDLLVVEINGVSTTARPYEFDYDIVDFNKLTNGFGGLVKPTKISTTCPNCAAGLFLQVKLGDPPFNSLKFTCSYCKPAPPPLRDPFINPVTSGRINSIDLDPIISNFNINHGGVASESFVIPPILDVDVEAFVPSMASPVDQVVTEVAEGGLVLSSTTAKKKKKKKKKKVAGQLPNITLPEEQPPLNLEKAEGLTPEVDFDDASLVESQGE